MCKREKSKMLKRVNFTLLRLKSYTYVCMYVVIGKLCRPQL